MPMTRFPSHAPVSPLSRGYTLIELVVAVGLFALTMTLSSGAYLLVIDLNRQAQSVATGINNLSFVLETMTRKIRTGVSYSCGNFGGDCPGGGASLSFRDANGTSITYARGVRGSDSSIGTVTENGSTILTDPSVNITSLTFYVTGTGTVASGDYNQPHITIALSGTVTSGSGDVPQPFAIQTGATMRGVDLTVALPPVESPPLPTCTLAADSGTIISGGSVELSWTTTNADSFAVDQGVGTLSPAAAGSESDTPSVTPPATVTYTGTATNSEGSGTCSVQVAVQAS